MRRISNVRLPQPELDSYKSDLFSILLDPNNIVLSITPMGEGIEISSETWDGDWLSPMGIDLQMNGGLGISFPELTFDSLPKLLELLDLLWEQGVEAICPTLISCDPLQLKKSFLVLDEARRINKNVFSRCKLLGAHLEGPFIAKSRHGAHSIEHLCGPSLENFAYLTSGFENQIAIVTLAPELPGADDLISKLVELGIIVSLGHSKADSRIAKQAFAQGVSMLTHTFNAMSGLHHRDPGPIGEAISNGNIAMGLIADGAHVSPNMISLLNKMASGQLFLVSDAVSPYGLTDGQYIWDHKPIFVDQGISRLANGTLAGATLPLLEAAIKMAQWTRDPSTAIWAATISPRLYLGRSRDDLAHILGKPLQNLIRWHLDSDDYHLSWYRAV